MEMFLDDDSTHTFRRPAAVFTKAIGETRIFIFFYREKLRRYTPVDSIRQTHRGSDNVRHNNDTINCSFLK